MTQANDSSTLWSVFRQDDNGNEFEMHRDLPKEEAKRLARQYETTGHKQLYSVRPTQQKT